MVNIRKYLCFCGRLAERYNRAYTLCVIVSLFIMGLMMGTTDTYGNLQPYLVSYIRVKSRPSSLRYTQSTYLHSTLYGMIGLSGFILGPLIQVKLGPKLTLIVGGGTMSAGVILSFFVVQYSYGLLFLTFGFVLGVGSGIIFVLLVVLSSKWAPNHSGLAVGFVTSGLGLGALLFGAIQTGYINRDNDLPNEAPYDDHPDEKYFTQPDLISRVPYAFLINGVIIAISVAVSSIFIINPPPNHKPKHNDIDITIADQGARAKRGLRRINWYAYKAVLSRPAFYLHWLISMQTILSFGVIASLYKTYGLEVVKTSDYFLTALGGVANGVFNTLGRATFGFIADKIGYKPTYALTIGTMAVLMLTLYITSLGLPIMYFIWVCGMYLCYGGYSSVCAVGILKALGAKNFNVNYPLTISTGQVVASLLYGVVSDLCIDNLGWSGTFLLIGCINILSMVFVLLLPPNDPTDKKYNREYSRVVNLVEVI